MRRSAAAFLVIAACICLTGCQEPQPEPDMQEPEAQAGMMEPDLYVNDPALAASDPTSDANYGKPYSGGSQSYGDSSYTTYPSTTSTTSSEPTYTGSTAGSTTVAMTGGSRAVHMVSRGDTLYRLARQYYNDERRWREIFEANRTQVRNPDVIRVGQELVIP